MSVVGLTETTLSSQGLGAERGDAILVPVGAGETKVPAAFQGIFPAGGPVEVLLASGEFKGDHAETAVVWGASPNWSRAILVGLGKPGDWNRERARMAVAAGVRRARDAGGKRTVAPIPFGPTKLAAAKSQNSAGAAGELDLRAQVELVTEAAHLGSYQYVGLKTEGLEKLKSMATFVLALPAGADAKAAETGRQRGEERARATNWVRDLAHTPANHLTPTILADKAKEMAAAKGLKATVFDRAASEKEGMGSFLSVAQGSEQEPRFILLEYDCGKAGAPTIGLIGKGVTFDSGGISIKPAPKMEEMKMDMCGAAAVLATMSALKSLGIGVNVVAAVPTTENMPSGRATKPGDVVKSYLGKTIEIQNTDAEGRLILADALSYVARKHKPAAMIDLATLTGAVLIALGHYGAAVLSNNDDLAERIRAASETSGDRSWRLPLWEEYPDHLKSDCADLKNIADGSAGAGTIAGGAFLQQFVGDVPWAHIDIAGTAWWYEKDRPHLPKGPSGYGVRLLLDLLEGYAR